NTEGTLDIAFDPNANGQVDSIAVQADGKILAGGDFTSIGGQPRNHIARLDATTGLADSFDPNANGPVFSIAVQADGKILAGGLFYFIGGRLRFYIARLDATTGLADLLFDPNANNQVNSIVVQADGKILAGGLFTTIGGQTGRESAGYGMSSLEADGRLDKTNSISTVSNFVDASTVQRAGKLLIGLGCQ